MAHVYYILYIVTLPKAIYPLKKLVPALLFSFTALVLPASAYAQAETWLVAAENYPPYSFQRGDEITGTAIVKVKALFEQAGIPHDIQVLPWARVVSLLHHRPNTLTPAIAKTPERLDNFLWVGPFDQIQIYQWHQENNPVLGTPIKSSYGVIRGSAAEQYLFNETIIPKNNIHSVNNLEQMVGLLRKGRVEQILVSNNMDPKVLDIIEQSTGARLIRGELIVSLPLYIGINKSSNLADVERLRQTFYSFMGALE